MTYAPSKPVVNGASVLGNDGNWNTVQLVECLGSMLFRLERYHDSGDNIESACKDAATLLHNLGKSDEVLRSFECNPRGFRGFKENVSLFNHLKTLRGKPVTPLTSRVVYVEIPFLRGRVTYEHLKRIFPNVQKIWRIIVCKTSSACLVEFASHSSARRAVDARQQSMISSQGQYASQSGSKCAWVSPLVEIPPMTITPTTTFPIIEYLEDDSIILPSTDWRRPRPNCSEQIKYVDAFVQLDLMSILLQTGAFDDYPPDAGVISV